MHLTFVLLLPLPFSTGKVTATVHSGHQTSQIVVPLKNMYFADLEMRGLPGL